MGWWVRVGGYPDPTNTSSSTTTTTIAFTLAATLAPLSPRPCPALARTRTFALAATFTRTLSPTPHAQLETQPLHAQARREAHWFENAAPPPPTLAEISHDRSIEFMRRTENTAAAAAAVPRRGAIRLGARANTIRGMVRSRSMSSGVTEPPNPPATATALVIPGQPDPEIEHAISLSTSMVKGAKNAKIFVAALRLVVGEYTATTSCHFLLLLASPARVKTL